MTKTARVGRNRYCAVMKTSGAMRFAYWHPTLRLTRVAQRAWSIVINGATMNTRKIILPLLLFVTAAAFNLNAAEITTVAGCTGVKCFLISGEIIRSDVVTVRRILDGLGSQDSQLLLFSIDSPGGDVLAAIDIGRLMRKSHATVLIRNNDKCYSACVFVLAGAVDRIVGGAVGIHRPYSTDIGRLDFPEAQRRYRDLDGKVREFLIEVNLPNSLFEAMIRIPPESLRILATEDLTAFGLNQADPVWQELGDAAIARNFGLTKREYLSLKSTVDRVCDRFVQNEDGKGYQRCREQILRKRR